MEATRFVDDANFLRSSMNLGNRDLDDHLRELLDNSIDAGATRIWIVLDARNGEMARLIVGDDGCGIPKEFEYRGKTYEGVPFVMAFGSGRNTHADETSTIGRFGFGLSTAIVSQARDQGIGRVYTKQKTDEDWRWSEYHFDRVVANKCELPPEQLGGLDFLPNLRCHRPCRQRRIAPRCAPKPDPCVGRSCLPRDDCARPDHHGDRPHRHKRRHQGRHLARSTGADA